MATAGFEHAIPGIEGTQNYVVDLTANAIGQLIY
jgi:hypothetical protein